MIELFVALCKLLGNVAAFLLVVAALAVITYCGFIMIPIIVGNMGKV